MHGVQGNSEPNVIRQRQTVQLNELTIRVTPPKQPVNRTTHHINQTTLTLKNHHYHYTELSQSKNNLNERTDQLNETKHKPTERKGAATPTRHARNGTKNQSIDRK